MKRHPYEPPRITSEPIKRRPLVWKAWADFQAASDRILAKNADLYKRLADGDRDDDASI